MIKSRSKVPKFISYCALNLVRNSLRRKCGYDVLSCSPIEAIESVRTPSLFIIGEKDDMVLYKKFLKMFEKCKSNKKKLIVELNAGHPDSRTEECIDQVLDFINADSLSESEMEQGNLSQGEKKASLEDILNGSLKSPIPSKKNSQVLTKTTPETDDTDSKLEPEKDGNLGKEEVAD